MARKLSPALSSPSPNNQNPRMHRKDKPLPPIPLQQPSYENKQLPSLPTILPTSVDIPDRPRFVSPPYTTPPTPSSESDAFSSLGSWPNDTPYVPSEHPGRIPRQSGGASHREPPDPDRLQLAICALVGHTTAFPDSTRVGLPHGTLPGDTNLSLSDDDIPLLDFPKAPPRAVGGFCDLYVAVYRPRKLKLAMRRLKVDFPTEDTLRRFRREAKIWSDLKHANILPFLGTMHIDGRLHMVSPWMLLGDLLTFAQKRIGLIREGKIVEGVVGERIHSIYSEFDERKAIYEIAAGLEYLHFKGIVHGDMKAKNVLLNDEGGAQICDFGLTKTLRHVVTSTELRGVGSLRWQSPELLDGGSKSAKSDVYAFGMTIAEVLKGDYPFPHLKGQAAVLRAIVIDNERPSFEPLSRLGVNFGPLWAIAAVCWRTNAHDRPSMEAILSSLETLERAISAVPPEMTERRQRSLQEGFPHEPTTLARARTIRVWRDGRVREEGS